MGPLTAVDLFAGAGGATRGLKDAGFDVIGAVELDTAAAGTYSLNHPEVHLWNDDVRTVTATGMARDLSLRPGDLTLLKACPPCQGFSSLTEGRVTAIDQKRNDLVLDTIRFVRALKPRFVMVENVPGLGRDVRFAALRADLVKFGYVTRSYIVNATDFGVPQRRRRLIMIAGRGRRAVLPSSLEGSGHRPMTVRDAFDDLADLGRDGDPLDVSRAPSRLTAERLAAIPVGGTRFDLPLALQLDCHKAVDERKRRVATGSYGRMKWSEPSPTMTTRCTTVACGSFVHPDQDRGITLREAATLQTFPHTYDFVGGYDQIERQIGNAVPVRMVAAIASEIRILARRARVRA